MFRKVTLLSVLRPTQIASQAQFNLLTGWRVAILSELDRYQDVFGPIHLNRLKIHLKPAMIGSAFLSNISIMLLANRLVAHYSIKRDFEAI